MQAQWAVLKRDLLLGWRGLSDTIAGISFFVMIIALVPLAIGPDTATLTVIAPAILWIAALLATLPQMERLFARDDAEGGLDHLLMIPAPLPLTVLTKIAAAWLLIGLPLTLTAPLLGMMLALPLAGMAMVMLALAIGTFGLLMLGMIAAALVLGARRGGVLIAILVLPLAMPILIFGVATSQAAITGDNPMPPFQFLLAVVLLLLAITPWATAMSLRHAAE
jgi:heme exporter protein B